MTYYLTWLMTGIVVVASVILGVVAAFVFRGVVARTLWALLVSLAFMVVAIAAVLADLSWLATDDMRLATQALALLLLLSGVVYAMRARD